MFMKTFMSNGNGLVIINNPPPKTDSDNLDLLASRVSLIMEMKHTGGIHHVHICHEHKANIAMPFFRGNSHICLTTHCYSYF